MFTILLGGVKGGIERLARVLMPTLAVMLIALVGFVLTLDNAFSGVRYYLVPDFSICHGQWCTFAGILLAVTRHDSHYLWLLLFAEGQYRGVDTHGRGGRHRHCLCAGH